MALLHDRGPDVEGQLVRNDVLRDRGKVEPALAVWGQASLDEGAEADRVGESNRRAESQSLGGLEGLVILRVDAVDRAEIGRWLALVGPTCVE